MFQILFVCINIHTVMNIVFYAENKKSKPQILGFVWQQISEIQSTFESLFSQIKTWDYSDKIY